jgi:hypothetical protein
MYLFVNTKGQIAHCPTNPLVCHLIMGHQLPSARHDKLKESLNKLRRTICGDKKRAREAGGSRFVMGISLLAHKLVFDSSARQSQVCCFCKQAMPEASDKLKVCRWSLDICRDWKTVQCAKIR